MFIVNLWPGFNKVYLLIPGCETAFVDVVFLIDDSGSLGDRSFKIVKDFVSDVITQIDMDSGNVRVAAILFSTDAQVMFYVGFNSGEFTLEKFRFNSKKRPI